jgi:hypothetical protein
VDLSPLHGSHGSSGGGWLGQDYVIVLSTMLHSLGALAWVLGTVAWAVWRRTLWEGHNAGRIKRLSDVSTIAAIAANFLGGTLRLFQPGHPGLENLGSDAWVQLIFVKHIALVGAVVLSVWMHWRLGPRILASFVAGRPDTRTESWARIAPWLVLSAIALAAILGAASTVALD